LRPRTLRDPTDTTNAARVAPQDKPEAVFRGRQKAVASKHEHSTLFRSFPLGNLDSILLAGDQFPLGSHVFLFKNASALTSACHASSYKNPGP
jgi:hypothetical protein